MGKSINPMLLFKPSAEPIPVRPRSHRLDEFAASYSLTGCSPAGPVSASLVVFHLQTDGSYLSTASFKNNFALDLKARTRQTINIRGGPN
jgi:hypothetical protein